MTDYEKDLAIDPDALDVEWLEQPELLFRYSSKVARTQQNAALAAERTRIVKSEIIRAAQEDPESTIGNKKATVQAIEAYYRSHKDYVKTKEEQIKAEYEASILAAAVSAIHQRKAALENLVRLHGMQYFAGPNMPRDLKEERDKRRRRADEKIRKAMKRTKTRKKKTKK